jgi:hypothetical protein
MLSYCRRLVRFFLLFFVARVTVLFAARVRGTPCRIILAKVVLLSKIQSAERCTVIGSM